MSQTSLQSQGTTNLKGNTGAEIRALDKLGTRVQQVQSTIPIDKQTSLPVAYVDPIKLSQLDSHDDPFEATVAISNLEGFPTVNGVPIWERLENEPFDEYELFQSYRELPYKSLCNPKNTITNGTRTLQRLASLTNKPPQYLSALAKVRHWKMRCLAYDKYIEFEREFRRRQEVYRIENKHAKQAELLFDQCMQYFKDHPHEMTSKVALEALKVAAQLHRISLGLPGDKPADEEVHTGGGSGRTIVNILNQGGVTQTQAHSQGQNQKDDTNRLFEVINILNNAGALSPIIKSSEAEDEEGGAGEIASDPTSDETFERANRANETEISNEANVFDAEVIEGGNSDTTPDIPDTAK